MSPTVTLTPLLDYLDRTYPGDDADWIIDDSRAGSHGYMLEMRIGVVLAAQQGTEVVIYETVPTEIPEDADLETAWRYSNSVDLRRLASVQTVAELQDWLGSR